MTIRSRRSALASALLVAGCSLGGPGQQGDLGNDRFQYACVVDSDSMCDDQPGSFQQEPIYGLPVIALGATFGLDTDGVTTEARSINDFVDERGTDTNGLRELVATKPGWAAVASFTFDGQPVDVVHVLVVDPTAAILFVRPTAGSEWAESKGTPSKIVGSHPLDVRIAPADANGNLLAGGLQVSWTATPSGIVDISPPATDNVVHVSRIKDGDVTLTAKLGAFTTNLDISVEGGEMVTSSSSSNSSGGGGGAGGTGGAGGGGLDTSSTGGG